MGQKGRPILLLLSALLFVLVAVFYLLYYLPLAEQREQAEYRLAQLTTAIDRIEKKNTAKPAAPPEAELSKLSEALPVKPSTHELILDLDKLKTLSGIQLESVTFDEEKKQSLRAFAQELQLKRREAQGGEQQTGSQQAGDAVDNDSAASETTAQPVSTVPGSGSDSDSKSKTPDLSARLASLPDTPLISIEMTLKLSGDYQQLYQFITEVREMSRYLRVDQIVFESGETQGNLNSAQATTGQTVQPAQATSIEPKLTATLKLISYYVPQYASLIKKLPPVQLEKPSDKQNPTEFGNS